jgi:hypothetical protein
VFLGYRFHSIFKSVLRPVTLILSKMKKM